MARSSDAWKGEEEELIEQGSPRRRVKEDLSDFTKALSSKIWGVASFLAPPPSSQTPSSSPRNYFSAETSPSSRNRQQEPTTSGDSDLVDSFESLRTAGIRSDFAEIGGTIKTGIARLSINGISKIASTFLPLLDEEEELDQIEEKEEYEDFSDVVGVTDEVLAFARNIACHPETWLDFPLLSDDDEEFEDFDMSVAQQDHALVVESLAPRLAALRIELCPNHISLGCFWMIYFALLHPRLNKHDAELLSTPQIVKARAILQHGLQSQVKQGSDDFWRHSSFRAAEDGFNSLDNFEMEKHSIPAASEAEFVDKFVVNEEPYLRKQVKEMVVENLDDDDEWPEDENNAAGMAAVLACDEEDISFSDLEEEDDCFSKQTYSRNGSKLSSD
ncbi:uncharacterized protein LOC110113937 [Dendrobium catenatum]|uniref:BSD domain-containing protein n=1 Tax=Dendrobium catenatum TaxID=906689 RepID=A0A2I0X6E0_9ASPA|nr:uncharacterized protein LOC110113937 [Dendrobium catenatum]PKU83472.1 hypothetical protein MA16_Dca021867 [Dendrobium catenatum]